MTTGDGAADVSGVSLNTPTRSLWYRQRANQVKIGIVAILIIVGVVWLVHRVHPGGLPNGVSLSQFESSVKGQLASTGTSGFSVSNVASVSCIMPNSWVPGRTFTCYAFKSSGSQLGTVTGTVLPTQANYSWNADIHWLAGQ